MGKAAMGLTRRTLIQGAAASVATGLIANKANALGLGAALVQKRHGWAPTTLTNALALANTSMLTWGNQILCYGGSSASGSAGLMNSMFYYDPALNIYQTITPTSGTNPVGRDHSNVAQGAASFFVWGGRGNNSGSFVLLNSGGVFTPDTAQGGTWQTTSTTGNCPGAREYPVCTAIDGGRFMVWGGKNGSTYYNTGAIYDPSTNLWTTVAAPSNVTITGRYFHAQVWTGTRLLIYGGWNGATPYTDAFSYDPATDTWAAIANPGWSAAILMGHVWTGTHWYVYNSGNSVSSIYDPSAGTWRANSTTNSPTGNGLAYAFWTGSHVVVSSGNCETGIYDITTDSWLKLPVSVAGAGPTTAISSYGFGYANKYFVMYGGYSTSRTAAGWSFFRPDY